MTTIKPAVPTATASPRRALGDERLGMDAAALGESVLQHLEYTLAELPRHVELQRRDVDVSGPVSALAALLVLLGLAAAVRWNPAT